VADVKHIDTITLHDEEDAMAVVKQLSQLPSQ